MLLDSVWNLLGWHSPPVDIPIEPAHRWCPTPPLAEDDDPIWPSARIGVAEALWGEGFLFPGGAAEVLRLAKPFGLTAASSLLPDRCRHRWSTAANCGGVRRLGDRL